MKKNIVFWFIILVVSFLICGFLQIGDFSRFGRTFIHLYCTVEFCSLFYHLKKYIRENVNMKNNCFICLKISFAIFIWIVCGLSFLFIGLLIADKIHPLFIVYFLLLSFIYSYSKEFN